MVTSVRINLESLVELSGRLNMILDEHFILNSAILSLMGKLKFSSACVFTPDEKKIFFKLLICKGRKINESFHYIDVADLQCLTMKDSVYDSFYQSGFSLLLPVNFQNEMLALICLGGRLDKSELDEQDLHYAKIVSTITSNALQNAKDHNSLLQSKNNIEKRNQLLTALFEMSRDFSTFLSKAEILKILSYRLMGQLMVSRFAIVLRNNDRYEIIINRFEKPLDECPLDLMFSFSQTLTADDIRKKYEQFHLPDCIDAKVISSMIVQGVVKGILIVGKKMTGEDFSEENLKFIEALGNLAISSLENERLFHEEVEKKRLESELELALEIQKNLLPKELPDLPDFDFAGLSIPSRLVGGDYYDFIDLPDNKILIAIADISGKGMPAALLMANVQAALRTLAPMNISLKEMITRINNIVYQNTTADKFVTFFFGVLDCREKSFGYINAGHNPPYWCRKNKDVVPLTEGGIILGVTENSLPYIENEIHLEPEDVVVLYTDGITEALDKNHKEFSEEMLRHHINKYIDIPLNEMLNMIIEAVRSHSAGIPQTDDITISAFRFKSAID